VSQTAPAAHVPPVGTNKTKKKCRKLTIAKFKGSAVTAMSIQSGHPSAKSISVASPGSSLTASTAPCTSTPLSPPASAPHGAATSRASTPTSSRTKGSRPTTSTLSVSQHLRGGYLFIMFHRTDQCLLTYSQPIRHRALHRRPCYFQSAELERRRQLDRKRWDFRSGAYSEECI
jgi:hypothetical protein